MTPELSERITMKDNEFAVLAMCLDCENRWIGIVNHDTPLFELECGGCHHRNSFASVLPDEYLEPVKDEEENASVH